jgi:hypothetical protein
MEGEVDKGKKEEALDPIMMDDDQIKQIMAKVLEYRRWCACFTIDDTFVTQP